MNVANRCWFVDCEENAELTGLREAALISAAASIAGRLDARRVGIGRWVARCPAHPDRAPSLTISEGREGRALLHCFAGCNLHTILSSAGLSMRQLFLAGPPPSRGQLEAVARQRAEQAAERLRERHRIEILRHQWGDLNADASKLARMLAKAQEDTPGSAELTACFHMVMDELRLVDQALTGDGKCL